MWDKVDKWARLGPKATSRRGATLLEAAKQCPISRTNDLRLPHFEPRGQ
jgi:hypothetical protein